MVTRLPTTPFTMPFVAIMYDCILRCCDVIAMSLEGRLSVAVPEVIEDACALALEPVYDTAEGSLAVLGV